MATKSFMSNESQTTNRFLATTPLEDALAAKRQREQPNQSSAESSRLSRQNPFVHESNNIASTQTHPGIGITEAVIDFQSNLLDNYDAVTYHWKLFMVSLANSGSGNVLDQASQVVIAETGVTDISIDKVEIRGVAVPTVETGTGTSTDIKFEIVEPSGAGLMDKMMYEALSLGVGNWYDMPLYLQLDFRARDPLTSNSEADGSPSALSSLRWLWSIKVRDTKADVNSGGTRYLFSSVNYNEVPQANEYANMQHNITLNNLATFGDSMAELENKINIDQALKCIDNYSIPDVYRIVVDPKIAGYAITPVNSNTNPARNNSYYAFHDKAAHFNPNTGVDKIIDTLLAATDKYQMGMLQSRTPGAEGVPLNDEVDQMKKFWRIVTEMRPTAFDRRRMKNVVEITIFIVEYDMGVLDANVFQSTQPIGSKESSRKRFMTYVNKGILKKKYNYIFTGLNDQVISLDLTLNNAFASAVTRMGGIYLNPSMPDKGVVTNDHAEEERSVTEKLSKAIKLHHGASTTNSVESQRAINEYAASVKTSTLPADKIQVWNNILYKQKPINPLSNQTGTGSAILPGPISETRTLATKLATPRTPSFVSDSGASSQSHAAFLEANRSGLRPIAFTEQVHGMSVGQGVESNSNSGVNKLATMFSVALHSDQDNNLITLKLTIKGDPFWLFPPPIQSNEFLYNSFKPVNEAIEFIKRSQNRLNSAVNLYGTDNFVVIRFRTPRIYNQGEAGLDSFTDVETLSGVYRVTTVDSKFEAGIFTQVLNCKLDPVINLSDISSLIEFESANLSKPTSVTDLTNPNKYNASNAPIQNLPAGVGVNQSAAETARLNGFVNESEAESARLRRAVLR